MLKKLLGRLGTKIAPYWCPYCPYRSPRQKAYELHYLKCDVRAEYERKQRQAIERIAPINRDQRRKMAKRAGQIKDWSKLNAE